MGGVADAAMAAQATIKQGVRPQHGYLTLASSVQRQRRTANQALSRGWPCSRRGDMGRRSVCRGQSARRLLDSSRLPE